MTNRRQFLAAALGAAVRSSDLEEITLAELQEGMGSGRFTARFLAEHYLARIDAIDKHGPAVNAVIELDPEALAQAEALDRERKERGPRGPLHGIPVLVKDNIDTAGRMRTTAGSLALAGSVAASDAPVVRRLRAAGALILGKTNLSEWANFRSTHSTSGWSGRGGQTRNPYALDRNPCGSSSGSAVAVSANLCPLAVGTETDGSIACPSAMNGIVGIKPTVGLLSGAGIIPIAHSQDTAGPMARTVRDAAALLAVMAERGPRDYTGFLDPRGLRGARLGVARKFFGNNAAVDRLADDCLAAMKRQGAEILDPTDLPSHGKYNDAEFEVLLYEFKADLDAYLRARGHSFAGIIAFNEKHADREMPYFGQEIMLRAAKKGPLSDKAYRQALATCRRLARVQGIDAVLRQHRLDAIVAPTAGLAWLTDWVNGDHDTGGCSTPAAVAGYPHITVPAGLVRGLPAGISFFGAAWSEPVLLKLAYSFEQATQTRRPPRYLATVDFAG